MEGNVTFKGVWTFTPDPTYKVSYLMNPDETYGLPEGAVAPVDNNEYYAGETVHVAADLTTKCEYAMVDGQKVYGTWRFVSWDAKNFEIEKDTVITGSWVFTPARSPEDPVSPDTGLETMLLAFAALGVTVVMAAIVTKTSKKRKNAK